MPSATSFLAAALTALALASTLLSSCSHANPETKITSAAAPTAAAPRSYGTRADSLDGIQGHHFGEPLSNFPKLVLATKENEKGVRVCYVPAAQECG